GGLDGDVRGAQAVLGAVTWFKKSATASLRRDWSLSAMPLAGPDRRSAARALQFPPEKGFFDDAEQPESRYVWRWVNYQAPDLVIEIRGGDSSSWQANGVPALKAANLAHDSSLGEALSQSAEPGRVPAILVTARAADGPEILQRALMAAAGLRRSPLHVAIA